MTGSPEMPPPRVLVVDDEPAVLDMLAWSLRRGGYEVVALSRFEDAKRYISDTPPDALVTDVRLGAFNGLQLAWLMRDARATAPVLVLSGYDDPTLRKEAERLGGVFHTKPVPSETLVSYLREKLGA